jgi:hypothetical protein
MIRLRLSSAALERIDRLRPSTLVTQPTAPNRLNTTPAAPRTASAASPKAPLAETRLKAPSGQKRKPKPKPVPRPKARLPCNTSSRYVQYHTEDPRRMGRYRELGHRNHVQLEREAQRDIDPASAMYLPANNHTARINYAEIATAHVVRFTDALPRSGPVFWVTLIADEYTFALDQAGKFDPFRLQQWVRAVLPGCSFVGMVEAALHTNAGEVKPGLKRAVSWHSHMLLWGIPVERMTELRDGINRRTRTMIPGVDAAHYRILDRDKVEGQVLYMLKAPVNEYRIYPRKKTVEDPVTRRATKVLTGRFSTKKYQLGPGDLVRMANLLSGKALDKLAFSHGEGKALLDDINYEARAEYRAARQVEVARAASQKLRTARLGPPSRSRPASGVRGP